MFTGNEEINSTHKRKVDNDSFDELQISSKKPLLEANVLPESPEQLESLLIPIDYARQLLASSKAKWPLKKLRTILEGSWMRYQAVRDRSKNPLTSFFIDCVIHVNRDGLRFKNTRENSYRSIIKLKECETSLDNDVFKLWLEDLRRWNVPVPSVDELKAKRKIIEQAIEEIKSDKQFNSIETSETRNITNEDETRVQIKSENILPKSMSDQNEMEKQPNDDEQLGNTDNSLMQSTSNDNVIPGGLTRENISKMVITIDELCRLLDYGKEVFERVVTGFFVEIRAPPNPNHKKVNPEIKGHLIYLDQVIGVNWVGKPYLVFQKPMTLSLKFRHFRDEKLKLLPCRNRNTPIDQKAINQWIYDTIEWVCIFLILLFFY
ncbi:hypothetical protein Mgra_00004725 [Meloidogyne graminicola]|uniref:Plus3 domain-containing protein n=1 Tax=Meloidogyne graminicola TaxID=189291 RepID=A0A8S9ZRJ9_9BILA|nr:hypothetical protein Mgra_00004725 [Meloidogyne graminicola]